MHSPNDMHCMRQQLEEKDQIIAELQVGFVSVTMLAALSSSLLHGIFPRKWLRQDCKTCFCTGRLSSPIY